MDSRAHDFLDQVSGIAALNEPARRALYLYVSSQPSEVNRDQAADACGVSRSLAAFHLDKLVDEGVLEPSFRRLTGRTGPGAGRPTKFYRRSSRQISISLPPRSYELAAKLFASALDGPADAPERAKLAEIARRFGGKVGAEAEALRSPAAGPEDVFDAMMTTLGAYGYEPYRVDCGNIRMRNCPFHALANDHRELVCGMNQQLMVGVIEALDVRDVRATLEPRPNECCVVFRRDH